MADYDVGSIGLQSPPASAPQANYTPAIRVKNFGIHARRATGYLRLYDKVTGVMVRQWNVASGDIAAGAEGNATADGVLDWSAEEVGKQFLFSGYVTCDNDQNAANNPLAPVLVTISAEPPPPPPPVEDHHAQHESGGADEIAVTGLHGELADEQPAKDHSGKHQEGGADELNVGGLHGELADQQKTKPHATSHAPGGSDAIAGVPPTAHATTHAIGGTDPVVGADPAAHKLTHQHGGVDEITVQGLDGILAEPQVPTGHHETHEPGGSDEITGLQNQPHAATHEYQGADEINVGGLRGVLEDPQFPIQHDNTAHAAAYQTAIDVGVIVTEKVGLHNVDESAHANNPNLEYTANKGEPNGYCELDSDGNVPEARVWGPVQTATEAAIATHDANSSVHANATNIEHTANKGQASGYCPLGADSKVPAANIAYATTGLWQPRFSVTQGTGQPMHGDIAPAVGGLVVLDNASHALPLNTDNILAFTQIPADRPDSFAVVLRAFGRYDRWSGSEDHLLNVECYVKNYDDGDTFQLLGISRECTLDGDLFPWAIEARLHFSRSGSDQRVKAKNHYERGIGNDGETELNFAVAAPGVNGEIGSVGSKLDVWLVLRYNVSGGAEPNLVVLSQHAELAHSV